MAHAKKMARDSEQNDNTLSNLILWTRSTIFLRSIKIKIKIFSFFTGQQYFLFLDIWQ